MKLFSNNLFNDFIRYSFKFQGCSDNSVSDKNVFYTFARTLPPSSKISKSVISLLNAFDWRQFVLIAGQYPPWSKSVFDAVKVIKFRLVNTLKQRNNYSSISLSFIRKISLRMQRWLLAKIGKLHFDFYWTC